MFIPDLLWNTAAILLGVNTKRSRDAYTLTLLQETALEGQRQLCHETVVNISRTSNTYYLLNEEKWLTDINCAALTVTQSMVLPSLCTNKHYGFSKHGNTIISGKYVVPFSLSVLAVCFFRIWLLLALNIYDK